MAKILKLEDIADKLTLATSKTKKLIETGMKGNDEFPKLFAEYKWPGTRDYNMALIIIALFTYCLKSNKESEKYKMPIKNLATRNYNINKLIEGLKEGNGQMIYDGMGSAYAYSSTLIEEILTLAKTDPAKWPKIKEQFFNQVEKIKSWKIKKSKMESVAKKFKKEIYNESANECFDEFTFYIKGGRNRFNEGLDHYVYEFIKKNNHKTLWKKINKKGNLLDLAFNQNNAYRADLLLTYLDCTNLLKNAQSSNKNNIIFEILKNSVKSDVSIQYFKDFVNKYDAISYLTDSDKKALLSCAKASKQPSFRKIIDPIPQTNLKNSSMEFIRNISDIIDISKKIYDNLDKTADTISEYDFITIQNSINKINSKTFISDLIILHDYLAKNNRYAYSHEKSGSIIKLQNFKSNTKKLLFELEQPQTTVQEALSNFTNYIDDIGSTAFNKKCDIFEKLRALSQN